MAPMLLKCALTLLASLAVLAAGTAVAGPPAAPWKDPQYKRPDPVELKKRLTPAQYEVTQREGTEPPFHNAFWNNHEAGLYVDVVSGEPLFSSEDKFESGTGWPSFTRPIDKANVTEKSDYALLIKRTEVRSTRANSHLGHVFDDGPAPTGLRYCINSAALRFVPVNQLEQQGYGDYRKRFAKGDKLQK